jgi:hypothetical protein
MYGGASDTKILKGSRLELTISMGHGVRFASYERCLRGVWVNDVDVDGRTTNALGMESEDH